MKSQLALRDHDAPLSEVVTLLHTRQRESRRAIMRALLGAGVMGSPLATYAACTVIPNETAGPFPGDGTNGPSALATSGIVRSDIRADFAGIGSATAAGIPMTMRLQLVNVDNNCALLPGYALYLWHCDGVGNYSLYGSASGHNFLRGVQAADATGTVRFTTMFPGAYAGRYPHMHFEIFKSLADAGNGRNSLKTSQLALPETTCREVYTANASLYPGSLSNLAATPLTRDGIFSDGSGAQMAAISGSAALGYVATLTIGIAAGAGVGVASGSAAQRVTAIEFYNTALDHYVVISDPAEAATIDSGGAGPGWSRTGTTYPLDAAPAIGSIPVYRFYGSVSPGPNSHFYTTSEEEKAALIALAAKTAATEKRWNYEGVGFQAGVASNGACPQSLVGPSYSVPVFRLYNKGFPAKDSNHRYATSTAVVQEMVAKGWALEGVAFCAMSS
jgi:protocatechuate 3,4-dioxygenase beta subunit